MSKRRFKEEVKDSKDVPPMSRLFIVCSKSTTEEELKEAFSKFGHIQETWLLKDRTSKESKGVAYIKFTKTSEAAKAVEEMNGKTLGESRPIKVMIAASRQNQSSQLSHSSNKKSQDDEERGLRLFIIIPKDAAEEKLQHDFGQFGDVDSISIIRDRKTKEGKGFAYIKFKKFSAAALAFEECEAKYKAVFADPRPSRSNSDGFNGSHSNSSSNTSINSNFNNFGGMEERNLFGFNSANNDIIGQNQNDCVLNVICSPLVNQDQLWKLFDIIPGLDYCQMNGDFDNANHGATVVYNNSQSAIHARKKLHGFEYPPGERLIVKLSCEVKGFPGSNNNNALPLPAMDGMMENREAFCSVKLPAPQPISTDPNVAQRCFIVCTPHSLPVNILKQAFCRFGNLIDVYLLPNRNCGYAKYSCAESAKKAMETLHGAEIYGVRLKVLEAEEPRSEQRKRTNPDDVIMNNE